MTRVEQLKNEIRIAARVCELRRLAEDTARTYDAAVAASGMTREHFRLRPMLLGMYAARDQGRLFLRFDFLAHLGQRFSVEFPILWALYRRPVVAFFARDR